MTLWKEERKIAGETTGAALKSLATSDALKRDVLWMRALEMDLVSLWRAETAWDMDIGDDGERKSPRGP